MSKGEVEKEIHECEGELDRERQIERVKEE